MDKKIFKAYDIRGIYPEQLDKLTANLIAQAYLVRLSKKVGKDIKDLHIVICQDNRQSSQLLTKEVLSVFMKYGVTVYDLGVLSINDYYFAVGYYSYDGGIMATASHNPAEYGGFKMATANPRHAKSIDFISGHELLQTINELEFPIKAEKLAGKINQKDIIADHLKHILSFIDVDKIKPLKVVVDTGGGMTAKMIPEIFKNIPAKLKHIHAKLDSTFSYRSPNPLIKGATDKLAIKVKEIGADLGVIYDVDGDRMFLVDEKGGFVRGDMVLCLLAQAMLKRYPGSGIAYNLICSHAVKDLVNKWGGKPIRSEVGYMNLARHMREEGGVMSGEVSAHFAFRNNFFADSGFIALVLALQTISEDGRPLSEIMEEFHLYEKSEEMNFKVDDVEIELDKFRKLYQVNILDEIDGITVEFTDWWFNIRSSNTEPLLRLTVEADNGELLSQKIEELTNIIDKLDFNN